jgi:hypothetical protein
VLIVWPFNPPDGTESVPEPVVELRVCPAAVDVAVVRQTMTLSDATTPAGTVIVIVVTPDAPELQLNPEDARKPLTGQPRFLLGYAAMGVSATVSDVRVSVFVDTHACDAVNAPDRTKLPADEASHSEM